MRVVPSIAAVGVVCFLAWVVVSSFAIPGEAACPVPEQIEARLAEVGLERASRTARFSVPPPHVLYQKASKKQGKVHTDRDGKKGFAVVVAEVATTAAASGHR